ncbi:MAG: FHA domain-containing protein [Patescibacteria group bacterium]|nr:FHA domain-containing protein [Patescibacteria group bacterium]
MLKRLWNLIRLGFSILLRDVTILVKYFDSTGEIRSARLYQSSWVGRQPNCDVCIPWEQGHVSRIHCWLANTSLRGWVLVDFSTLGTYVAGSVPEIVNGRLRVREERCFSLGNPNVEAREDNIWIYPETRNDRLTAFVNNGGYGLYILTLAVIATLIMLIVIMY